jgi:hypothetical protein
VEAFLVEEGMLTDSAFLVEAGLEGYIIETFGLPASVQSQLQTTLIRDGFADVVFLDLMSPPRRG